MKKALRTYSRDFVATIVLAALGLVVLFVILSQQASALPSWFPLLGEDRFELKTELQTAQAVTPGQGQTVNISGVKVGDVTSVDLEDGVAVVTMQVDNEYSDLIHEDATTLLRPRTGLQDMVIEVDPGTEDAPIVEEGFTVPLASSAPNVNFDQIIASLDSDTRAYLRLLLAGGAEALGTEKKSERFASLLRRLEPTTRDIARVNGAIATRRENLSRVITNFKLLAEELGRNDTDLAGFVESQNGVFSAFAEEEEALRATLRGLPGALRETRGALDASATLSGELGPALTALLPQARATGPALRATRPFFRRTLPALRDQIRPFTGQVDETISELKRGAGPLKESTGTLKGALTELNQVLNALSFNPSGNSEGYLFYLSWLNHNTNAQFLTQDGLGPLRRGLLMYSCFASQLADPLVAVRPALSTARDLTRIPTTEQICPDFGGAATSSSPAGGTAAADSGTEAEVGISEPQGPIAETAPTPAPAEPPETTSPDTPGFEESPTEETP